MICGNADKTLVDTLIDQFCGIFLQHLLYVECASIKLDISLVQNNCSVHFLI